MELFKKIYRSLISEKIRRVIHDARNDVRYYFLKKKVIKSILNDSEIDDEKQKIVDFLSVNKLYVFPYDFVLKTDNFEIDIHEDVDGYKYFIYENKRIYGKKKWNDEEFQAYFKTILMEQDKNSPHCYLSRNGNIPEFGDVVADLGAAEGFFALEVVDRASKVYCFEADDEWLEPLRKTIEPYKDKIEIVEKYVGGVTKGTISLDSFFENRKIDFIKADIEGFEKEMLENARLTFTKQVQKCLLVMYHYQEDEAVIRAILDEYGFDGTTNPGYMLVYFFQNFRPPYIRRGVVCFEKR